MENQNLYLVILVGWLVLVISTIVARRIPMQQMAKMALGWAVIFLFAFGIFAFKNDFKIFWQRIDRAVDEKENGTSVDELKIPQENDRWYAQAQVNGYPVRFAVDTSASTIQMNDATAEMAGVTFDANTATTSVPLIDGSTVEARQGTIANIQVGSIDRKNMIVLVAPEFGDNNVLGMNFLSSLSSWRVEQGQLILVD